MTNHKSSSPAPARPYLIEKAKLYLALGPARYRRGDAFGRPEVGRPRAVLAAVRRAFAQLIDGAGTTPETALENVGIHAFYVALHIAHFRPIKRVTSGPGAEWHFTDRIDFVHEVDPHMTVRIYNRVPAVTFD